MSDDVNLDKTVKERSIIEYRTEGAVAIIRLNRPEKRNVFNREMYRLFNDAIKRFLEDEDLRVAVMTASGDHFCGGVDLRDLQAAMVEASTENPRDVVHLFDVDAESAPFINKPIIVAYQGACYGQGVTFGIAADLRIASEEAIFCLPEVKLGVASVTGTARCVKNLGLGNAMSLLLTGDAHDAEWALRVGLVNEIVPRGEVEARAMELAQSIAEYDAECVYATRRVAVASQYVSFEEACKLGAELRGQARVDSDYVVSITGK